MSTIPCSRVPHFSRLLREVGKARQAILRAELSCGQTPNANRNFLDFDSKTCNPISIRISSLT